MSGHAAVALFAAFASLPLVSCIGGGSLSGPSTLPERAAPMAESTSSASAQSAPNAVFRTNPAADERGHVFGLAPLTVHFHLCGSSDAEDDLNWTFDFGDGETAARFCRAEHTYVEGTYGATVCVKDKRFADQSTVCKAYTIEAVGRAPRGIDFFTDFEGITPFTRAEDLGLAGASFGTSPADRSTVTVGFPSSTTSGQVLACGSPLTIAFDTPRKGATFGWVSVVINGARVQAYRNGSLVYSQFLTGTLIGLFGPPVFEGTGAVPVAFDTLVIDNFAIFHLDNLDAPAR